MKTITTERGITVFVSSDELRDFETQGFGDPDVVEHAECLAEKIVSGECRQYIDLFAKNIGLKGIAILLAHGDDDGRWLFCDREKRQPVQVWLREHDGKFACLICCVCNPKSRTVKTKKSLLAIPDRSIGIALSIFESWVFSLIHPKRGEIDNYIDYELQVLEGKIKE